MVGTNLIADYDSNGVWLCPIHGLRYDGEIDESLLKFTGPENTEHDFRIVRLPTEFKSLLESALEFSHLTSLDVHLLSLAIRCETDAAFREEPIRSNGLRVISFALSLGYESISLSDCYLIKGGYSNGGLQSTGHEWPMQGRIEPQLFRPDEIPYVTFYARAATHLFDRIGLAVRRFYEAGKRVNYADALVDYVIALDGLLTAYDARRFADRATRLVQPDLSSTPNLVDLIRAVYQLRSQLVHGNVNQATRILDQSFGGSMPRAVQFTRLVCTTAFQRVLREPQWLNPRNWR